MQEYEGLIGGLARRYACWYAPEEDLRQEGRLAAMDAVKRYDGSFGCSPASWAWHCVRGRMLHYRRAQRRMHGPVAYGGEVSLDEMEASGICWEVGAGAVALEISTACIDRVFVEELLAGLIPRHRAVLLLLYAEQWTGAEVAAALGVRGSLRALATRALWAVRRRLLEVGCW